MGCALLVVAGCKSLREPRVGETVTTGATETTGARMIMNDDAAMMLTNARCERETACDGTEGARSAAARGACRRGVFAEMQGVVAPAACPAGVDEQNLSRCIAELRRESCEDARHSLESLPGCTRFELCTTP
ncbi:MAG TPA: DUF6184 family natural product biosynthesis lipoprotein [Labilithrix sp.]|nr:DUF6184 family natural product biosynthesis lipoprotein [Labilithrix sp.]